MCSDDKHSHKIRDKSVAGLQKVNQRAQRILYVSNTLQIYLLSSTLIFPLLYFIAIKNTHHILLYF